MEPLIVSNSPHLEGVRTTRRIMLDVIIALCPALVASVMLFGWRALLLTAVTVASCVLFEFAFRRLLRRPSTVGNLSAVVTGLLLAFNLPSTLPLWMAVIGAAVAIIVVKEFFGGIGQNFANPALVARIVLMLSFTAKMTSYVLPNFTSAPDTIATATPLAVAGTQQAVPLKDLLLGLHGGCLGETCVLALLAGGIYLLVRRVISPIIPLCYLGTVALCSFAAGQDVLYMLCSGGLVLGAFFMATDYVTSPVTPWGRVIFAVGCGLLTFVIRSFSSMAEGVSFSIVIMNLLVPHIERLTAPHPFGAGRARQKGDAR